MNGFLRKRWFLLSLLIVIPSGLMLGASLPPARVDTLTATLKPALLTGFVLFLMAFTLDSGQLVTSFRNPSPVLWAALVNVGLIPLVAWPLMVLFQAPPDFGFGLMIAASVPCSMAAASVWTRKAGGNDAVSLLVTVVTNGFCFLFTPFWLNLTTIGSVQLNAGEMILRLAYTVLIPTFTAQAIRQLPRPAAFATRHKIAIGAFAQSCVLVLVAFASCKAGTRFGGNGSAVSLGSTLAVWGACIGVHLGAMAVAVAGAYTFRFRRVDRIAITFASSQKTLPIGVYLATDPAMFGNPDLLGPGIGVPFAVFPMLMYHASQLFIDTVIADRLAASGSKPG
jgi:sodium/bile acid cotransporter 7